MTYNPDDLYAIHIYIRHMTGLPADAVGVVGDTSHRSSGGYHVGNDTLSNIGKKDSDYSKRESGRDRPGTNAASAIDLGSAFPRWMEFNNAFLSSLKSGDGRLADVREFIYTLDGKNVRRWDRLGIRSTGDSSHLSHSHISMFRNSEGRRAREDNLMGWFEEFFEGKGNSMAQLTGPDPFDGTTSQAAELRDLYFGFTTGYYKGSTDAGVLATLKRIEAAVKAGPSLSVSDAQMATVLAAVKSTVQESLAPLVDAIDGAGDALSKIKS